MNRFTTALLLTATSLLLVAGNAAGYADLSPGNTSTLARSEMGAGLHESPADALDRREGYDPLCVASSGGINVGPNVYTYVRQNPWTYWDPEGLSIWTKGFKAARTGGDWALTFADVSANLKVLSTTQSSVVAFGAAWSIGSEFLPISVGDAKAGLKAGKEGLDWLKKGNKADNTADAAKGADKANDSRKAAASGPETARGTKGETDAQVNAETPTGTRYIGPEEAKIVEKTGTVPNTNKRGDPKDVFYTPDAPVTSATEAQKAYDLPYKPTHRVTVDTSGAKPGYAGNVEGGSPGAIEATTSRPLPATEKPIPLEE